MTESSAQEHFRAYVETLIARAQQSLALPLADDCTRRKEIHRFRSELRKSLRMLFASKPLYSRVKARARIDEKSELYRQIVAANLQSIEILCNGIAGIEVWRARAICGMWVEAKRCRS